MTRWSGGRQYGAQDAAAFGREYAGTSVKSASKKRRQAVRTVAREAIRVWRARWAAVR